MFEPSEYQKAIFEEIKRGLGRPDLFINALAGSGKTTTIVEAAKLIQTPGLFAAFNVSIAEELASRLAGTKMAAINFHKIGKRALDTHLGRKTFVADRGKSKYYRLAWEWAEKKFGRLEYEARKTIAKDVSALAGFCRKTLCDLNDPAAIQEVCDHFGLYPGEEALAYLPKLLEQGIALASNTGEVDFDDMIYLPVLWKVQVDQFEWIFCDEAQDMNKAQLELAMMCRKPGGRMVLVADRNQAIYGFAGADNNSVQHIIERLHAMELPLSICYRCDQTIIDLAQRIVPAIEARPNAPAGSIKELTEQDVIDTAQPGDMFVCRLTAPLVSQCIRFIKAGIPARVEGRDIGGQLAEIIDAVAKFDGFQYPLITSFLMKYEAQKMAYLTQQEASEDALVALQDRVSAVMVCVELFTTAHSVDMLKTAIQSLFDEKRPQIKLATIHRVKGLEAETVFLLKPEKLPLSHPKMQSWQTAQEYNLAYVAITRAKHTLYIVGSQKAFESKFAMTDLRATEDKPEIEQEVLVEQRPEVVAEERKAEWTQHGLFEQAGIKHIVDGGSDDDEDWRGEVEPVKDKVKMVTKKDVLNAQEHFNAVMDFAWGLELPPGTSWDDLDKAMNLVSQVISYQRIRAAQQEKAEHDLLVALSDQQVAADKVAEV